MLAEDEVERIRAGLHGEPFRVLGLHADERGRWWLRAFLPGATQLAVLDAASGDPLVLLDPRHADGYFEGMLAAVDRPDYRLHVSWTSGQQSIVDDPYRFGPVLSEREVWQLAQGTHLRPFELLGATHRLVHGVAGTSFAVWAPHASRVAVVGDFNRWDGRRHPLRLRPECGVWEIFLPGVRNGARYKYEIRTSDGHLLPQKADPFALQSELPPGNASVVTPLPPRVDRAESLRRANAADAPISIYEVHTGSWRRKPEEARRRLTWDELAETLVPYACEMGFTHLQLMPVAEHLHDDSWGYRPNALFAPTARHGDAAAFRRFVAHCHRHGLAVILDWATTRFAAEPQGLANFDGTSLFERDEPGHELPLGHASRAYDITRPAVCAHLCANALFWLERYGVDGFRLDSLPTLLFHSESNSDTGNHGTSVHEAAGSLDAIGYVRRLNELIGVECPGALLIADESSGVAAVSRPASRDGLGFGAKWNTAWLLDSMSYLSRTAGDRVAHHDELTLGLAQAFDEHHVLALSHDEMANGRGALLARLPGDRVQQFAALRAWFGWMYGHPGKKHLFMGSEFGQAREWDHEHSLDWHLLADPLHDGLRLLVRDLNHVYRETPALHRHDFDAAGFEWIVQDDAQRCLIAFQRVDPVGGGVVIVVCNFAPVAQRHYRLGVPRAGVYRERINTDSQAYVGGDEGSARRECVARSIGAHGATYSIELEVPALTTLFLEWTA